MFLGDSQPNLNRLPAFVGADIQVDSYSAANVYHFSKLLEQTPINTNTAVVVLSVGLKRSVPGKKLQIHNYVQ